jgi:hypothetical protein
MWKLMPPASNDTTEKADPQKAKAESPISWDKALLDSLNLTVFLIEAKRRGVNPNDFESSEGLSALRIACLYDKSGDCIKQLLAAGNVDMEEYEFEGDYKIWAPLSDAVSGENWHAVDILLASEDLDIPSLSINWCSEQMNAANVSIL